MTARAAWTEPGDRFDKGLEDDDAVVIIDIDVSGEDCHGRCKTDSTVCGEYGICKKPGVSVSECSQHP